MSTHAEERVKQIVWATSSSGTATIKAAVYVCQLIEKMNDQVDIDEILSHVIRRRDSSDDEAQEPYDDDDDEKFISIPEQA